MSCQMCKRGKHRYDTALSCYIHVNQFIARFLSEIRTPASETSDHQPFTANFEATQNIQHRMSLHANNALTITDA